MGVHATFCQLCALPTQHDHYVPSVGGGLRIYRGRSGSAPSESGRTENGGHDWADEPEKPFPFGPQHAWLKEAVGLDLGGGDAIFRGPVEDGGLDDVESGESIFVWDGNDDALVFHERCWALMGSPKTAEQALRGGGTLEWSLLERYHEQLFEFRELEADGKAWMLADPATDARSKARIVSLIEARRHAAPSDTEPTSLAEVLSQDVDWTAVTTRVEQRERRHLVYYRQAPHRGMSLAAYPHLLCLLKDYAAEPILATGPMLDALERFQLAMKSALEHDGLGVMVLTSLGEGKAQYLAYVKDLQAAHVRVDALPGRDEPMPARYDDSNDPTWRIFLEEMGLPKR